MEKEDLKIRKNRIEATIYRIEYSAGIDTLFSLKKEVK